MDTLSQRDLLCPRCRYNLRALTCPRCPECGLYFDAQQWESGLLRANIPTWLDHCDPRQPHQVLIRSLWTLLSYSLGPRRLASFLDLNGPPVPALLMLLVGTGWLYSFAAGMFTVATLLHSGASPAAAFRFASLSWAPRAVLVALVPAAFGVGLWLHPTVLGIQRPSGRAILRVVCYALPVLTLHGLAALSLGWLVNPYWSARIPVQASLALVAATIVALRGRWRNNAGPTRTVAWRALLFLLVGAAATALGAATLLPASLEPPISLYF